MLRDAALAFLPLLLAALPAVAAPRGRQRVRPQCICQSVYVVVA